VGDRSGPRYPAVFVARLARGGRVVTTARVAQWLVNHDYDVAETVADILSSLPTRGKYRGSCLLMNDAVADEYVVTLLDCHWYLKFWVDDEQLVVDVWSCCWDGAVH